MMTWPQILVESTLAKEPDDDVATAERPLAMSEVVFQAFYEETARPLWAFICRVCGKAELADDLLQETYLRFLRAPDLKAEAGLRKAYLYKIATNLMTDHWRTSAREQRFVVTSHSDEKFHEEARQIKGRAGGCDCRRDLSRVFQQLKPMERSLLWLAYVEGSNIERLLRRWG
jgi:RNA polymerase sigma-70 factor (ECF subfamily)